MAKAGLKYNQSWYTPVQIKQTVKAGGEADVRREYTRLRDISQKRLKRLLQSEFAGSQVVKMNLGHFPKLKDIKSTSELAARLSDLSRFIDAAQSTVSGQRTIRKKALETLHEHGYDFIDKDNYEWFAAFMEEYRMLNLDENYDSGDAAELFNIIAKEDISPEKIHNRFEYWLKNLDLVREISEENDIENVTELRQELIKRKKKLGRR